MSENRNAEQADIESGTAEYAAAIGADIDAHRAERPAEYAAIHDEIREWYERYPHEWGPLPEGLGGAVQMLISDDVMLRHRLGAIGGLKLDNDRVRVLYGEWQQIAAESGRRERSALRALRTVEKQRDRLAAQVQYMERTRGLLQEIEGTPRG